jgi:hypothetical protein
LAKGAKTLDFSGGGQPGSFGHAEAPIFFDQFGSKWKIFGKAVAAHRPGETGLCGGKDVRLWKYWSYEIKCTNVYKPANFEKTQNRPKMDKKRAHQPPIFCKHFRIEMENIRPAMASHSPKSQPPPSHPAAEKQASGRSSEVSAAPGAPTDAPAAKPILSHPPRKKS